jgi:hypothetical protein
MGSVWSIFGGGVVHLIDLATSFFSKKWIIYGSVSLLVDKYSTCC